MIKIEKEVVFDLSSIYTAIFNGTFSVHTPNETYKQLTMPTKSNVIKSSVVKDASGKTTESYEDAIIDN